MSDVRQISRKIEKKYKNVTIAGTKKLTQDGGAIDIAGLKSVASGIGRGISRAGKGIVRVARKAAPEIKKGVGYGVKAGLEVGRIGKKVTDVKLEEWKREKLGEYPYGQVRPTGGFYKGDVGKDIVGREQRRPYVDIGEFQRVKAVPSPARYVCPHDKVAFDYGAKVLDKAGIIYCPICGQPLTLVG